MAEHIVVIGCWERDKTCAGWEIGVGNGVVKGIEGVERGCVAGVRAVGGMKLFGSGQGVCGYDTDFGVRDGEWFIVGGG